MSKLTLSRVEHSQIQGKYHTIFQTIDWMRFVSQTQNAEPVVALVRDGECQVGVFYGLIIKKYGLRILGSPFPGWSTSYMGFCLEQSVSRVEVLLALKKFAFSVLKCIHIEIMDRHLKESDLKKARFKYKQQTGFEVDLTKSEEAIFAATTSACRRCIRKAARNGVRIEIADDLSFVDDYYSQLEEVFAKQNLVPTYPIERVRSLIECLLPTGNLLLLRARDKEGDCIATGIFPALNDTMYFWGGGSWRRYQILRPNEAMQWFAMLYWKERGVSRYDMGGGGDYKRKYGGVAIAVPWGRKSKYLVFAYLRNIGMYLFIIKQRISGWRKQR
ncbi:GNAT family N-acetyltransferase [Marinilabiliaceae bacterium JC017]|nr:GNAT family N-acetyltransferase [Marinilabiliaceae bacterium JC017]